MRKYKTNNKDLAVICENLGSLYEAGIPFLIIFELMQELKLSKDYQESLNTIKELINDGTTLEGGFRTFNGLYPEFFVSMIDIGEKTGRLSDVLTGLNMYYSKMWQIKKILINTLTYPLILVISSVLMMTFLLTTVVPTFGEIYISLGKEIPNACKAAIYVSEIISKKPYISFVCFVAWIILIPTIVFKYFLKEIYSKASVKIQLMKDITEYISIVLLSIVIRSGVNISLGLQYCSVSNIFNNINEKFILINDEIMQGKTLAEAMCSTGIFSKYTLVHIKLGEESGGIEKRLVALETEIFNRIIGSVNKKMQMLGPILILIIGSVILLFILVFILPLFDIMTGGQ